MSSISVSLATFNGETFLLEQLRSLAAQTRLPDELVVGDDGSTDSTLAIIRDFAACAPFKVVILPTAQRLGYRSNFMRCAQNCTGSLIAFCDQDDVWDPIKLSSIETSIKHTTLLLQHDFRAIDESGNVIDGKMDDLLGSGDNQWAPVLGLTQVFRRELLAFWPLWSLSTDQNNRNERMAHDQWVHFLATTIGVVQTLRSPLLSYRQHNGNVCGLSNHRISHDELKITALLRNAFNGGRVGFKKKRDLIRDGLQNALVAGQSRSEIIQHLLTDSGLKASHSHMKTQMHQYMNLNFYNYYRLRSYQSSGYISTLLSLARSQPHYLTMGVQGLKDFTLDAVLAFQE